MDERTLLFALHETKRIGHKTIGKIVKAVSPLSELPEMDAKHLADLGIAGKQAELILHGLKPEVMERKLELYRKRGIGWITVRDEAYPEILRQIPQPPWVLYYKGDLSLLKKPVLAIVGTRTPTVYGIKTAEELARSLSQVGFCVVSGLARGIDSAAHAGALMGNSGTIGVLGNGLDRVYPAENLPLYRAVAEKGLLLTEYPLGTPPHPGLFLQRNRIIAGLSLGTIVVEAAARSGSLITAEFALEASRDVFAVPGPVHSPKSQGTLDLIKKGAAKLITSVNDIIEEYTHLLSSAASADRPRLSMRDNVPAFAGLTEEERKIYDLLCSMPRTIDELLEQSQINFGHLHSVLLSLLMKQKIRELPGCIYTAI